MLELLAFIPRSKPAPTDGLNCYRSCKPLETRPYLLKARRNASVDSLVAASISATGVSVGNI